MTIERANYREYRTIDKAAWGRGPWDTEPDKAQWVDAATGLDCLIVRNRMGTLCGYVGVPETHPWFKTSYNDVDVDVHGGLTFSDQCQDMSHVVFEKWSARLAKARQEMIRLPAGDSARMVATQGHLDGDYAQWLAYMETTAICHVPAPGADDHVWWFGFDCGHAWDLMPGTEAALAGIYAREGKPRPTRLRDDDVYRDWAYVTSQIEWLAAQLDAAGSPVHG